MNIDDLIRSNNILSDINVVKNLIMNKKEIMEYIDELNVDLYYKIEIINIYSELNKIIKKINITKNQLDIMTLLMNGYSYSDIGKITNRKGNTISETFNRLCIKIVQESERLSG